MKVKTQDPFWKNIIPLKYPHLFPPLHKIVTAAPPAVKGGTKMFSAARTGSHGPAKELVFPARESATMTGEPSSLVELVREKKNTYK